MMAVTPSRVRVLVRGSGALCLSRRAALSSAAGSGSGSSSAAAPTPQLSHVDSQNRPCMVDVSHKAVTTRSATARALVVLPPEVFALLQGQGQGEGQEQRLEILGKKGPVFATAVIAGTQGVKKTPDLIPFCHPLPVEHVSIDIGVDGDRERTLRVACTVRTTGKTGVEMEALTGASVAALCIYDMLKAASHDIQVQDLRLEAKSGGKADFERGREEGEAAGQGEK